MSNFSLTAFFGLDTKRLKHGLDDAQRSVSRFQSLLGSLGIAAGMAQITMWFREVVKHANESESGIDKNIDAIQRWSRQLESLKSTAMDVGTFVLGGLNRIGEALGDTISKAFFDATQEQLDAIRAAEASIAEIEQKLAKIRKDQSEAATAAGKIERENEEKRKRYAFERMSSIEQETALREKLSGLSKDISNLESPSEGEGALLGKGKLELEALKKTQIETQEALRKLTEARQKRELDLQNKIETVKLDALYEQMDEAEKLLELQRRLLAAEKERAALNPFTASTEEALQANLKVTELQAQVDAKSLSIAKEKKKLAEDAADKELKNAEQIEKLRRERTSASLGDLESGRFGRGMASRARRVSQLEERATRARVRGRSELAERLAKQAEDLRDRIPGLRDSERSAEKVMESGFDKTVLAVESVREEIKKLGESAD